MIVPMFGNASSKHGRLFTVWRLFYQGRALPFGKLRLRYLSSSEPGYGNLHVHEGDRGVTVLPDGSAFATASWPLPKDHWLTKEHDNVPPMPFRMGLKHPLRGAFEEKIRAAAQYAVRCATMNGKDDDMDPDALVQSMVVGMLGYFTPSGLSNDSDSNPSPTPEVYPNTSRLEEWVKTLWGLLDDIDTMDDAAKSDDVLYRQSVRKIQQRRWEKTGITTDGYTLDLSGVGAK